MNRIFITLLTACFALVLSSTALADHHNEDKASGAHAQCTHAADAPCPHAAKAEGEGEKAKQCTKHAAGEPCTCHGKKGETEKPA